MVNNQENGYKPNGNGEWPSVIARTENSQKIEQATHAYLSGLVEFASPTNLSLNPDLREIANIRSVVEARIKSQVQFISEIILERNVRANFLNSEEYHEFLEQDIAQWRCGNDLPLIVGVRACNDKGVGKAAVAAEAKVARTLAGDDDLLFVPSLGRFILGPNIYKKKITHAPNTGNSVVLEFLYEHTGCGRRGQNLKNLHLHNEFTGVLDVVMDHLDAFQTEFIGRPENIQKQILEAKNHWNNGHGMRSDGGIWAGMWVKIAQRQAYRKMDEKITQICPVTLYDKRDGNLIAGIDDISTLTDGKVFQEGGFTDEAIDCLAREGKIFSLKHEVEEIARTIPFENLAQEFVTEKGASDYYRYQADWFSVKQEFSTVTKNLWRMLGDSDTRYDPIRKMVEKYKIMMLGIAIEDLQKLDESYQELILRRITHQLFRAFSYAWVLDTFENGNIPGLQHLEDHGAYGDNDDLGEGMMHTSLGQGQMSPLSAGDLETQHQVLMHSPLLGKSKPFVVTLKMETTQADGQEMTLEESTVALSTFAEMLEAWPDIVLGVKIPVVLVRDKSHGGFSRLGLTILRAYGNIVELYETGQLPSKVQIANSHGEVVWVPAEKILHEGVLAGDNLAVYNEAKIRLADIYTETAHNPSKI